MTYPQTVDKALQQTIFDWFQYRSVCDNERFNTYFNRVLNRDIGRYNELLRIQPGVAQYDWLVEEYLESERTHEGSNSGNTSNNSTTTNVTNNVTNTSSSNTDTTNAKGSETGASSNSESTSDNKTTKAKDTASDNSTKSGKSSTKQLGSEIEKNTSQPGDAETVNRTRSNSHSATRSQDPDANYDTTTETTSQSESGSSKGQDVRTPDLTSVTNSEKNQVEVQDTKSLNKTLPMSSGGGDLGKADEAMIGNMPAFTWTNASAMGENFAEHKWQGAPDQENTHNTGTETTDHSTSDNKSQEGTRGATNTISRNEKTDESTDETEQETHTFSTNKQTERTFNGREEEGTNSESGQNVHSGTNESEESGGSTRAGSQNDTRDTTSEQSHTGTQTGATKTDTTVNGTSAENTQTVGTDKSTDRERHTGRHGNPAAILEQAAGFIKQSSAWAWLEWRLEPCFLGIYDV